MEAILNGSRAETCQEGTTMSKWYERIMAAIAIIATLALVDIVSLGTWCTLHGGCH